MRVPRKSEIPHKIAMYELLDGLLSNPLIANNLCFKGGTCASMLGCLDRFSVDLDFDLPDRSEKEAVREEIYKVIDKLRFEVKDESRKYLQFFLKYRDIPNKRNTLKLEITDKVSKMNEYKEFHLVEIGRYCRAQTIETMFANKLVALKGRFEDRGSVAGRDVYDIYHFFNEGFGINEGVIEERTGKSLSDYARELISFVEDEITEKILREDLNPVMDNDKLKPLLPKLKKGVLIALKEISQ